MSDVRFTPVDEVERETAREPAKRWHNWWRVRANPPGLDANATLPIGEEYEDGDAWPTKKICEEKARDELQGDFEQLGFHPDEWLGAFPEGETP